MAEVQLGYVDGKWVREEQCFDVVNPATGELVARVADLGRSTMQRAIDAAAAAFPSWAAETAHYRAALLRKWSELILSRQEGLAQLMTSEQGKPLAEARAEIAFGATYIEWFAEEGKRAYGDVIPTTRAGKRYLTLRQPIGVVAAITPWNFPNAMLARKLAPALAAGCTVVAKPAAETPLSALALAELAHAAGIPPGVLNIVPSTDADGIGRLICESPVVRALSFTGSTMVGKRLYAQCAGTMKKLALELGGNAPVLIFDDADLDQAVEAVLLAKFRNAGQTCVCANRILVQSGIHDAFAARYAERVRSFNVGAGHEPGVEIGPLINERAVEKVERLVSDALAKGARALVGGARHARRNCYQPTVLTGATPEMALHREEIFGPVAALFEFQTEDQAIAMANDTRAGLAAYVFTRDLARTLRTSAALECGIVSVNEGLPSVAVAPFGGVKESGLGREGGRDGLHEFMDTKYVCIAA